MIELKNVSYAYHGALALQDITLSVQKGSTVILQGPNGCGKSTLLKLLNGLIFPDAGEYYFEQQRITAGVMQKVAFSKSYHQRVGYVFQSPDVQLFCGSVEEEIAFGPQQMGFSPEELMRRVEDTLALLNIGHLRYRPPYHLSGGEKKKVAIACVLAMNPSVWTLDEPMNALDSKTQLWLIDFLKSLRQAGKTIVVSTHDAVFARELGDVLVTMDEQHCIDSIV